MFDQRRERGNLCEQVNIGTQDVVLAGRRMQPRPRPAPFGRMSSTFIANAAVIRANEYLRVANSARSRGCLTLSAGLIQETNGNLAYWSKFPGDHAFDRFTDAGTDYIARRDRFYIATASEIGWSHIQHRGGPPGSLRVLDEPT